MARALTQSAVEKRKPDPVSRKEVPDGIVPGLYLVVQTSGAKSWALRYRLHGRTRKHTLGALAAFDVKDARELARDALAVVAKGRDPSTERKQARLDASDKRNEVPIRRRASLSSDTRSPRTSHGSRRRGPSGSSPAMKGWSRRVAASWPSGQGGAYRTSPAVT